LTTTSLDEMFNPARPAGAYDALLARVLPQARVQRQREPADGPLPSLFVSHGAPPTLDDPQWLDDLFAWGQSMPKPRGIVVVSAHSLSAGGCATCATKASSSSAPAS
jgi:4,5-DOPA dioxygenase extradiol